MKYVSFFFEAALLECGFCLVLLQGVHCIAQETAPVTISRGMPPRADRLRLSWPAIPGRTYEVRTRDGLESEWSSTNLPPIEARSTRASTSDAAADPLVPVRFYQIRAQPIPPGNTGAITATTIAELEKVLGLTFTEVQRRQLLSGVLARRRAFEAMRSLRLLNSDSPPLLFDPLPMGFVPAPAQETITWSAPKNVTVPENRAELAFYTVRDLGELIRTRKITSRELTELYLNRLKRYNPTLRCVITLTEELALRQAARADEELAAGTYRGPLHGIPYGIKDLFSVRGYPTTWGAAMFQDQVIDEDASVVRKLEEAGAVLIAKLSTGELAVGDIWFGGQTKNPWNINEGSSGSSAGSGSATAAGLVAFSIGTETWGSIAEPCTRCRVTGLRTTFGRISRTGAMNITWSMDKIGPICREVEDCAIVLEAIRGADGMDRAAIDQPFNYDPRANLRSIRIGYRQGQLRTAVRDRLAAIVGEENLIEVTLPTNPVDTMLILEAEGASAFDELIRLGADALLLPESHWRSAFRLGRAVPAVEYLQANRHRRKLIEEMAKLMETVDVYVCTQEELLRGAARDIMNLTGQPCVIIPHGPDASLGFTGRPFEEAIILSVAKAYQDATTFHSAHPPAFAE